MTFAKILVPMDGSEAAERVLDSITGFAHSFDSELVLVAVTGSHTQYANGESVADVRIGDESAGAERYLSHQAERIRAVRSRVTTLVRPGIPADVILAAAEEVGADLIAMATHRGSVLARGILGSVTDAVLRTASLPVLAMNPDGEGMHLRPGWTPSTIVVPLDGSELAEQSVPVAIELAKACGAGILFLQALHLPSYAVAGPGAEYYGVDYGVSIQREGALEYLAQFVEMSGSAGVAASSHAALGNAAGRIVEDSQHIPDAMIVISSHGRSGFKRMLLGSVADKVVRASHHPVLVLKPGRKK